MFSVMFMAFFRVVSDSLFIFIAAYYSILSIYPGLLSILLLGNIGLFSVWGHYEHSCMFSGACMLDFLYGRS